MGIVSYMKGTAYRRGVVGNHRYWFGLWVVLAGAAWLRKHAGKSEPKVLRVTLEPGERLLLSNEPPPER
jgi:hypothetical protein